MRWLFRPSMLVLLSVGLALGAAAVVLWPRPHEIRAAPLEADESEIVWLYSATNALAWERFVTGVSRAAERLADEHPDLAVRIDDNTFPRQTTAHPELAVTVRRGAARLVFRWYKLTSDQKIDQWVAALLDGSRRPPLAIIGGSSSDQAKEIALSLQKQLEQRHLSSGPLLLLTAATADRVPVGDPSSEPLPLTGLYRGRSFRFCFTNQQMAGTVMEFVGGRDELRPDGGPFYVAQWADDLYSLDLTGRFLAGHEGQRPNPEFETIDYSVGGFDQPNRWEAPAAERLMAAKVTKYPHQERPLLVLAAPSSQPARRFLRGLARAAPAEARRFVVVTGDALSFNTVYRDRNVAWQVQDLPFELVFFCHRNPVEVSAGFPREEDTSGGTVATGTEDLLLYRDLVEALVEAAYRGEDMPADGDALGRRLREVRWLRGRLSFTDEGAPLFDADGNRRGDTGEHVVWVRPAVQGEPGLPGQRVQPQATIEVWAWRGDGEAGRHLKQLRTIKADYEVLAER